MKEALALAILILTVAVLACVAVKEAAPQPGIPLVDASALVIRPMAPPQFCTTPMPVCQNGRCPRSEGVA